MDHAPLPEARMKRGGTFLKFMIASVGSFLAILGGTALLHQVAGLGTRTAYAITLVLVFVANFLVLRMWVYGLKKNEGETWRQFLHTAGASAVFRLLEYIGFLILHALGTHYLLAIILVMIPSFLGKFFYYKLRVFRSGVPAK